MPGGSGSQRIISGNLAQGKLKGKAMLKDMYKEFDNAAGTGGKKKKK